MAKLRNSSAGNCGFDTFRVFLRAGASSLVLGGLLTSQAALAQDRPQTTDIEEPGEAEQGAEPTLVEENVIVVSGIRQSLANSQDIKRDADTVVDAITAEDIGALPDRSVTEALQRVPGIAINRFAGSSDPDHFSVEGAGVTVRGLNFVRSEFNGRTAFAAGVGGQALSFADVPSELLGSVIISKNATADMTEGGLAGTVNLNTRKPFDRPGFHLGFSAEANYGDLNDKWSPTLSGLISNTWDTEIGRFGLLASASYSRVRSRSDGIQVANFQTRDGKAVLAANEDTILICRNPLPNGNTDEFTLPPAAPGADVPQGDAVCGNFGTPGADGFADYADYRVAPVGGQFRSQEFDRKRDGFAVSAQFESIDQRTVVTAEYIRSHTTNSWGEYTQETGADLSEYQTFPIGCLQNSNGPRPFDEGDGTFGSYGDATSRAECPIGEYTDFIYDENNLFQSGYIVNTANGWRGDPAASPFIPVGGLQIGLTRRQVEEETTNEDYSLNLRTELTDRLTVELDAQYAKSKRENLDFSVIGSMFADQELDISGEYPTSTFHKPTYLGYVWQDAAAIEATKPDLAAADDQAYFNDPRFQFWRAAMDHYELSTGEQFAFSADAEYEFEPDAFIRRVKAGARYQDRDQTVRYSAYNWGMLSEVWSGTRPVHFGEVPADSIERYDFPNFFRGEVNGPPGAYYYNGDVTGNYDETVAYLQQIKAQAIALGGEPTWVPGALRDNAGPGGYLPEEIQPIYQRDSAAYVMASFGSDTLLPFRFSGNIGVRYVDTFVRSAGSIGIPSQQALNIESDYDVRCAIEAPPASAPPGTQPSRPGGVCLRGEDGYALLQQYAGAGLSQRDVARSSYDYFLPSLNLKFGLSDDLILRLAASKVMTRPDNSYLRNFLNVTLEGPTLTAQTGNPGILPATAWQFDASLEWYFARVGSLTFNAFYKDIENFFYQRTRTQEITSNGVTLPVNVRGPENFDGHGEIKGFEVAYQQTFDFLPSPLDGFGVQANYTYLESKGLPNTFLNTGEPVDEANIVPGNLPLEQLSKHNYNVTGFYEKGPISLRAAYNWRSRFLLTAADVIFPYYSIFNEPTGQLDASVFFNVSDALNIPGGIRVGVQGVNLLNEVTKTSQAYNVEGDLAPRSYFMNDRRFSFIIRGNF